MKVVCIDTSIQIGDNLLEYGKVYEGELIFNFDGKTEWENNYLNLEGWTELDWFSTKNFTTLDAWRSRKLNDLGI
jgi:hypothetical protein